MSRFRNIERAALWLACALPLAALAADESVDRKVVAEANGEVIICDNKTDKCSRALPPGDDITSNLDAMTVGLLRIVKDLTERVANLESKLSGRKKKAQKRTRS